MFKIFFKISWRKIKKNKLNSSVNLTGLAIGLSSCILICLYIFEELSYDKFNTQVNRIVRVTTEYSDVGTVVKSALTGTKVGPELKRTFPQIESYTRVIKKPGIITLGTQHFSERNLLYADPDFFKIFSFSLKKGDPAQVLSGPDKVVITEKLAVKYFGSEDPVGKVLLVNDGKNYLITGVTESSKANSQIQFDLVASFASLEEARSEHWWITNYVTYLLLHNEGDINPLGHEIDQYMNSKLTRLDTHSQGTDYLTFHLEPLRKVHLYSSLEGLEPNGNILQIYILGAVGLLILIIACFNYTNLSIAQATSKSGEISIRKLLGAGRPQLFMGYLGESVFLTFIAMSTAVFISIACLPALNNLSGKSFQASTIYQPISLLLLFVFAILCSFLAGFYPAFILSNLKIIKLLKTGFRFSSGGANVRKALTVSQFVITVFLLISTMVIFQQLTYIRQKDLGYDKEHIVLLPVDRQMHSVYDALKKSIQHDSRILSVSGAYETPTFIQWGDGITTDNNAEKKRVGDQSGSNGHQFSVNAIPVDLNFINTLGLKLVAGTDFTESDLKALNDVQMKNKYNRIYILNESLVKAFGWTNTSAIGKIIYEDSPGIVKAVVKDFHFTSLHQPIGPLFIFLDTSQVQQMLVKINGNDIPGTLGFLEKTWKTYAPGHPFLYHFLNDEYNALYKTENQLGRLFSLFSLIAILLGCMGLFALTVYTTAQRTKEIGIRKVLGASVVSITTLLSVDFLKLVAIASLIAFPISWYATHSWLQDFAYRIEINWMIFVLAGVVTLLIAWLTISFQSIKAALANPLKSLKVD